MTVSLLDWLRRQTEGWQPSAVGIFQEQADHDWPLSAASPAELRHRLTETGHLLPLPTEPAALANVMEIELREHLTEAAEKVEGLDVRSGTERSYPDLEFSGPALGDGYWAVDIKCARRKSPTRLNNAVALYTGNTWFLWPQLKFGGVLRPFGDYNDHIAELVLYEFDPSLPERIKDVVVIVHETWRLASRKRASATREYIGSVTAVDDLVSGRGEFETPEEFYEFWRSSGRRWKDSPEAKKLLRRALEEKQD
jgi:hypothetical protein